MQVIAGRLFMVVLMICGPMMVWSGYQANKQNQLLAKEGRETIGSIVEAEVHHGRKGRRDYHFIVRYQIPVKRPMWRTLQLPPTPSNVTLR